MTMAKIMIGIATLFFGEKLMCEAIAADMIASGEKNVEVVDLLDGETAFSVL